MSAPYRILDRVATIDEYRAVCQAVGWGDAMNFDAAERALPQSLYGVVACCTDDNTVIGMGRVVGDGAIFFYIQDFAVVPEHQGRGVGMMMLDRLLAYLDVHAPDKSFIGLFATDGALPFYRQRGFAEHPFGLTGMGRGKS